jgi:glycosyltransferase involved in cell wall biosynthesis
MFDGDSMKILQISAAYFKQSGGVAIHVHTLTNALVRLPEISVDVITLNDIKKLTKDELKTETPEAKKIRIAESTKIIKDGRGDLIIWKCPPKRIDGFSGRRLFQEELIDHALKKLSPKHIDVIHVHDWDSLHIGWVLGKVWKIPVIMTVHRAPEDWYDERSCGVPKDSFMETIRMSSVVSRIVVPSNASKNVLDNQHFPNVTVIPHGVSSNIGGYNINPDVLNKYGIPIDRKIILCPVRAEEHKDPEILVRAAPEIMENNSEANPLFVFLSDWVGKGIKTNMQDLRSQAKHRGMKEGKNVLFLPQIQYGPELFTVFKNSFVIVIPSVHESFGLSVLDAFSCMRPVVARNSMALKEIIKNRQNGLLFGDSIDLASQVGLLFEDPDLYNSIVKNALSDLQNNYQAEAMAKKYLELYKEEIAKLKQV